MYENIQKIAKYWRYIVDVFCFTIAFILTILVAFLDINVFSIPNSPQFAAEIVRGVTTLTAISIASTTFLIGFYMKKQVTQRIWLYFTALMFSIISIYNSYQSLLFGELANALNKTFLSFALAYLSFFNLLNFVGTTVKKE